MLNLLQLSKKAHDFHCLVLDLCSVFCPVIQPLFIPWIQKMSRSGYFKDLGNFGQQIINQVANDIRSNAENLVYSFGQDQQGGRTNPEETSGPSVSSPSGQDRPRHQRSSSTSSSQATTPEEVAGDWLNNVSSTLSYLIVVLVRLFFWGKNSGVTALFDDGTFNENPM